MQITTPIAENHIRISRKLFDEGMRAVENKSYKKEILKLILIIMAIYLIIAAWLLHTGGSLFFLLGESLFLGAILFWLSILLPGSKRHNKYKAMMQGRFHFRRFRHREVLFLQLTIYRISSRDIHFPDTTEQNPVFHSRFIMYYAPYLCCILTQFTPADV